MATFINLIGESDKESKLLETLSELSNGSIGGKVYSATSEDLNSVPGSPYAYWVSPSVRRSFIKFPVLQQDERWASFGASTKDDFRFLRLWWELPSDNEFLYLAKGGEYSPFYSDLPLKIFWENDALEMKTFLADYRESKGWSAHWTAELKSNQFYKKPGITWGRRTQRFGPKALPSGCVFGDKGPAIFTMKELPFENLCLLAIICSAAFRYLVGLHLNATDTTARSFEVGVIQKTPIPDVDKENQERLAELALGIWNVKRTLDSTNETSHFFSRPYLLPNELINKEIDVLSREMHGYLDEINQLCFDLYDFSEEDCHRALDEYDLKSLMSEEDLNHDYVNTTLSWAAGVAFGRFRLDESSDFHNLGPFDSLTDSSPCMRSPNEDMFHDYSGVLVDEVGHKHDLTFLVGTVLESCNIGVEKDIRRWIGKDFFAYHLSKYSKSRRQAPIFWPLQTESGKYTLWLDYQSLSIQTPFICVNNFVDPKLLSISSDIENIRLKSSLSADEERELSALMTLEIDLKNFRDEFLEIAKYWVPNLTDGVLINAAPLWKFFQHKPWRKITKKAWGELEQGKYDWSNTAYSFWPERVLRKCHQDHSMAISHDVENDLWDEVEVFVGKNKKAKLVWRPKEISNSELDLYIQQKVAHG